jgi:hypothetical protein
MPRSIIKAYFLIPRLKREEPHTPTAPAIKAAIAKVHGGIAASQVMTIRRNNI